MQKQFFISAFSFLLLITGCTTEDGHYAFDGDGSNIESGAETDTRSEQRGDSSNLPIIRQKFRTKRVRRQQKRAAEAYNKKIRRINFFSFPEKIEKKWGECTICFEQKLVFQYCLAKQNTCTIWQCEACCTELNYSYRELQLIDHGQEFPYTVTSLEARCPHCREPLPGAKEVHKGYFKFYTNGEMKTILSRRDTLQGPLN